MKKLFLLILLLLGFQTLALAQTTLLPQADAGYDECRVILDQFELTGQIMSSEAAQSSLAVNSLQNDVREAEGRFNEAQDVIATEEACQGDLANTDQCKEFFAAKKEFEDFSADLQEATYSKLAGSGWTKDTSELLGCAIQTGRISLAMIPYFVTSIINYILGIAGLVSVLFIVIGGYHYIWGGVTDDKEKGKKTIVHALTGLGLALMAWTIVQVVLALITG
ncbi:hypothetical protein GF340_01145 [Candidatus Peregrinibacteria bacterium]|nr:hypothetical protein [Candidatus Peregrinibacteria bacterium]